MSKAKPTTGRSGRSDGARLLRGPVERPAPLRHAVFDALVDLIISRQLEPGEHLREGDLAEQLGVSRQPVREAFQQLHAEGWIDLKPGQGAFVHSPTDWEADDLLAVRSLLEAESARRAAAARTDDDVAALWALWKAGKDAVAGGDLETMLEANVAMHDYIMGIAENRVLAELSRLVDRRVRWYYRPIARQRSQDSWDEHAEVIRAIADGDEERAFKVMKAHTEHTRQVAHEPLAAASE
jgi:DNA-binding GntR family transcriptional regulator